MKVIQVGLGDFGWLWFKDVLMACEEVTVIGLVDRNPNQLARALETGLIPEYKLFPQLVEALQKEKPDFILNTTPPSAHKEVNELALHYGIPVLCEKPISDSYDEAFMTYQAVRESNVPFMIAENFRFKPPFREMKKWLNEDAIGKLSRIDVSFFKKHQKFNYHQYLKHPLLLDVTIHHLDMMRYLLGCEAEAIFAHSWTPRSSNYRERSNANLLIEWENGVHASYRGSLDAGGEYTDWNGTWRIEGDGGLLIYDQGQVLLNGRMFDFSRTEADVSISLKAVLREFINSLSQGRPGETDMSDNWHTFSMTYAAIQSIETNSRIQLPTDYVRP